jgi:hypothetical protein
LSLPIPNPHRAPSNPFPLGQHNCDLNPFIWVSEK